MSSFSANAYYDLQFTQLFVGGRVEKNSVRPTDGESDGALVVAGCSVREINQSRLRRMRDNEEDDPALMFEVRDNGRDGDGVMLSLWYKDKCINDEPILWLNMTHEQAAVLHGALDCVLKMRAVQDKVDQCP